MQKIVLTGGGTAGHIYPALAVAEKLKDFEIHYIGGNGLEKDIIAQHSNITYHQITTVKLQRKLTLKNLLIPFKLFKAIRQAKQTLKQIDADIVFSKGGFVAVPVCCAAKSLHLPIISHESDLSLGLANKIILRQCSVMCTSFEETATYHKKCVYTGQPIRSKIFHGKKLSLFENQKTCLLVLGGSLGAKFLNDIILQNLDQLTKKFNIIHITGKNNFQEVVHKDYKCLPYAENIEDCYATADIVLARAGSGVINELLALEKPMLLAPLSKACSRGDQIENAKLFEKLGFCKMIEEENYSFEKLQKLLDYLCKNAEKIKEKMHNTAKNNAVDNIIKLIEDHLKTN